MKVVEFDVFFLSYDEPTADLHYADLCNKVPWAKRIHGVKGSDHAHRLPRNNQKLIGFFQLMLITLCILVSLILT